uniref:Transposase n=1 Tax=Steinernema glaseri TaxID=37863 RepID=A0A1I8ARJ1_9BILA
MSSTTSNTFRPPVIFNGPVLHRPRVAFTVAFPGLLSLLRTIRIRTMTSCSKALRMWFAVEHMADAKKRAAKVGVVSRLFGFGLDIRVFGNGRDTRVIKFRPSRMTTRRSASRDVDFGREPDVFLKECAAPVEHDPGTKPFGYSLASHKRGLCERATRHGVIRNESRVAINALYAKRVPSSATRRTRGSIEP